MPRGRHTSLTIQLTAEERQTLMAWQRSTTISMGRAKRGRIILLILTSDTNRGFWLYSSDVVEEKNRHGRLRADGQTASCKLYQGG